MAPATSDGVAALVAAVRRDDIGGAAAALAEHRELRSRLNDPLPGLPFDSTLMHAAVQLQNLPLIDLLLDAGADINQRTHWWAGGFHVLELANPQIVPSLIERGATVSINAAARLGMHDRVAALLRQDPRLARARGGDGQTPLHVAATVDVAALLLEHGADIDALDVDHESTPAQYLVGEHAEVASYLVSRGARADILLLSALGTLEQVRPVLDGDPNAVYTSVSGKWFPMNNPRAGGSIYIWTLGARKLPHLVARERNRDDVFDLLMERSPGGLRLAVACELHDVARADALYRAWSADAVALTDDELFRLPAAAERGDGTAVSMLLERGWPGNATNESGATALHWASHRGAVDMVRTILAHSAPTNVRDGRFNATPLDWARHHAAELDPSDRARFSEIEHLLTSAAT